MFFRPGAFWSAQLAGTAPDLDPAGMKNGLFITVFFYGLKAVVLHWLTRILAPRTWWRGMRVKDIVNPVAFTLARSAQSAISVSQLVSLSCLSIYLSVCLTVCLSVSQSVRPSVCLFAPPPPHPVLSPLLPSLPFLFSSFISISLSLSLPACLYLKNKQTNKKTKQQQQTNKCKSVKGHL